MQVGRVLSTVFYIDSPTGYSTGNEGDYAAAFARVFVESLVAVQVHGSLTLISEFDVEHALDQFRRGDFRVLYTQLFQHHCL